jgi:integrase
LARNARIQALTSTESCGNSPAFLPLFPAKANKYGIISDAFSKRYGRFLRETVRISDKLITFHSWRHTFADSCRDAGVPPDVRMALMGHTEGGAAGAYGSGNGLHPRRLIEAINAPSPA